MSIANRVDCTFCFSSPCKCSEEAIQKRIKEQDALDSMHDEENLDVALYLNR